MLNKNLAVQNARKRVGQRNYPTIKSELLSKTMITDRATTLYSHIIEFRVFPVRAKWSQARIRLGGGLYKKL